ncbi:MAG: guanylate kinase, partial [Actinomycetota bacterium]
AAVLVFVAPPQFEELERRLKERNTEADAEIEARLKRAREELASQDKFDYIVINESVDKAAGELEYIFINEIEEA